MAAKMTVSIPDELYERVKAESHLNVSALTQKALIDELRSRELVQGGNEAAALVERLGSEEQDVRKRYLSSYQAGRAVAAKRLSAEDLDEVSSWYERTVQGVRLNALDRDDLLVGLADCIESCKDEQDPVYSLTSEYLWDADVGTPPRRGAVVAFVTGIDDVWKQAREAL